MRVSFFFPRVLHMSFCLCVFFDHVPRLLSVEVQGHSAHEFHFRLCVNVSFGLWDNRLDQFCCVRFGEGLSFVFLGFCFSFVLWCPSGAGRSAR